MKSLRGYKFLIAKFTLFIYFSVNSAFTNLRLLIPTEPKNRKLSKIETLRLAKSYIAHLDAILITNGQIKQPCLKKDINCSKNGKNEVRNKSSMGENRNICTFCVSFTKQ